MKNFKKIIFLVLFCQLFIIQELHSQFSLTGGLPNFGNTNAPITGVGIGNWPFATPTNARFHINNFYCNNPGGALNGLLFRTDGNSTVNNSWTMQTGPNIASLLPRFTLTVPAGTNVVRIQTNQPGSSLFFSNGAGIDVMRVNSTGGPQPANNGNVMIRKNVIHAFYTPAFLDIGGPIAFSSAQTPTAINPLIFHNTSSTGATVDPIRDGFRMLYDFAAEGVDNGDGLVFEKTDGQSIVPDGCIEFTNYGIDGIRRLSMTINGTGNVGCGANYNNTMAPWRRLSVGDSNGPQFRLHNTFATTLFGEIFTDFETTNTGNLNIDPRNAGVAVANVRPVRINYGLGNAAPYPNVSLDINGQENIRTVNQDNTLTRVLVWEPVSGNVRWSNAFIPGGSGAVTADNGLRISSPTNAQWGQLAGTLPVNSSQLTFDTEIPMNNWNLAFSKNIGLQDYNQNNMVIGTSNASITPLAKLEVIRDLSIANNANTNPTALRVENTDISQGIPNTGGAKGVYSIINADNKGSYAGYFIATTAGTSGANIGLYGEANNAVANFGVIGVAQSNNVNTTTNIAGDFTASGIGGSIGVRCDAPIDPGLNYALLVIGDALIVGGTDNFASDSKIKTNVQDVTNASNLLVQIKPKTYNYKYNEFPSLNLDKANHYGVIAQEVQAVLPSLVHSGTVPAVLDSNNNVLYRTQTLKTVVYQEFIPILIAGFNEQQERIDAQDSTIAALVQQNKDMMENINNCCSQGKSILDPNNSNGTGNNLFTPNINSLDVKLTDQNTCILNASSPNPFNHRTVISYNIPQTAHSAQIIFYNMLGEVIKIVDLNYRGEGRLNVFGEDLRSGMYSYTLIIDGTACESKKMIKE